jgi:hypothetical protein
MNLSERMFHAVEKNINRYGMFKALEERTGVPAYSWNNAARGRQRPTTEMIEWVCQTWPEFAFWIATGTLPPEGLEHQSSSKGVRLELLESSALSKEPINWTTEEIAMLTNEVLGRTSKCRFPKEMLFLISDAKENAKRLKDWIAEKRKKILLDIQMEKGQMKAEANQDLYRLDEAVSILKAHGAKTE